MIRSVLFLLFLSGCFYPQYKHEPVYPKACSKEFQDLRHKTSHQVNKAIETLTFEDIKKGFILCAAFKKKLIETPCEINRDSKVYSLTRHEAYTDCNLFRSKFVVTE